MPYPVRGGFEAERMKLIWEIYEWCGSQESGMLFYQKSIWGNPKPCNKNREHTVAWDLAHIFAAIAGGYVIELSPHYKGVQLVRKNKKLWEKVSKFVKLKTGEGCLPYDIGSLGERWEKINDISFFSPS